MSVDMCLPVLGNSSNRRGITPVVSIVLLLMMTVAAAGAAYSWFTDIQSDVQKRAEDEIQTSIEVRSVRCITDSSGDYLSIELKNTGKRNIGGTAVDIYVYDSDGNIYATITNQNWQTNANWTVASPPGTGFLEAGGFGRLAVEMPASTQFVDDEFYTSEIAFSDSEISVEKTGCIAE